MHQESGHTSFPFSALTSGFRPKAVRAVFPLLLPALSTLGDLFHSKASAYMQLNSLYVHQISFMVHILVMKEGNRRADNQ